MIFSFGRKVDTHVCSSTDNPSSFLQYPKDINILMPSYRRYSSPAAVYHAAIPLNSTLEVYSDDSSEYELPYYEFNNCVRIVDESVNNVSDASLIYTTLPSQSSEEDPQQPQHPKFDADDTTTVVEQLKQSKIQKNGTIPTTTTTLLPQCFTSPAQSSAIHIDLRKLSHSHPLAILQQKAIQNAHNLVVKHKILIQTRAIFQEAMKSFHETSSCMVGNIFYWSVKGLQMNLSTDAQKWLVIDHHKDWLHSISNDLNILESWKAMYIGGVDHERLTRAVEFAMRLNSGPDCVGPVVGIHATSSSSGTKILDWSATTTAASMSNMFSVDDPRFVNFVNMCYVNNKLPSGCRYRIRKVRWIGKNGLAIWFHDTATMHGFLEKGKWYMDMWSTKEASDYAYAVPGDHAKSRKFDRLDELWEKDCLICGKTGHRAWMHQSKG